MGRELTPNRIPPFTSERCPIVVLCGISIGFPMLSPCLGQIAHALLTRPPLEHNLPSRRTSNHVPARLACVKHAASVRPEPGSNSDVQSSPFHRLSPQTLAKVLSRARLLYGVSLISILTSLFLFALAVSFSRIASSLARFTLALNARVIITKSHAFVKGKFSIYAEIC